MKRTSGMLFFAILCLVPVLASGATIVLKVKVQAANVRTEPNLNSQVVKTLPLGTLLEAQTKINDWYEILVANKEGQSVAAYINKDVVDVISGEEKKEETKPRPVRQPAAQPAAPPPPPPPSVAVTQPPARIYYGRSSSIKLLGGLTFGKLAYSQEDENSEKYKKSLLGFNGGIGFETGGNIGLEFDLMYIQKGVEYEGSESGVSFDYKTVLGEITAPVLLKIKFMSGSTPYIVGGGEVSYIMTGTYKYEITSGGQTSSGSEDLKKQKTLNDFDFGIIVGAGFELEGSLPLFLEGRYHYGLANINKTTSQAADNNSVKTRTIVLMVGIKF